MFKIAHLLFAPTTAPVTSGSIISSEFPTLDVATGLYFIGDTFGFPVRYSPYEQVLVSNSSESVPDRRVHLTSDSDITISDTNTYYLADTSNNNVTITLPQQSTVPDGFKFGVNRAGDNNCTIELFTGDNIDGFESHFQVLNGYMYEFMKSPIDDRWDVIMKESKPETGKQSHLVGFWLHEGRLKLDILATSEFINVDLDKYNLTWKDGTPSWRLLDSSVEIETLLDSFEIVLHN